MPTEPEVAGLLALIRLHRARADARFDADGTLVLLEHQDRSRWDHASDRRRDSGSSSTPPNSTDPAPTSCRPPSSPATPKPNTGPTPTGSRSCCSTTCSSTWRRRPSPVCTEPSPCATSPGPQAALAELDTLAGELDQYHLYHATRAELLRALGHPYQARAADRRALELTSNPAEQALLQQRINWI